MCGVLFIQSLLLRVLYSFTKQWQTDRYSYSCYHHHHKLGFALRGKSLERSFKFAFVFIEISWGWFRVTYCGDLSILSPLFLSWGLGSGPSAQPAGPAFAATQVPAIGHSQGAGQASAVGFGSVQSSAKLSSSAAYQRAPPFAFSQQSGESAFGSRASSNSSACAVACSLYLLSGSVCVKNNYFCRLLNHSHDFFCTSRILGRQVFF